jgi:hypothetical protein
MFEVITKGEGLSDKYYYCPIKIELPVMVHPERLATVLV